MALAIKQQRSRKKWQFAGAFFATFAFIIQGILPLNIPAVFAADNSTNPQITSIGSILHDGADYKGMSADVTFKNVKNLKSASVTVNRADGTTVTKTMTSTRIFAINLLGGGAQTTLTAPFVIQALNYNEANSNTWSAPSTKSWTKASTPKSVTVSMTFTDSALNTSRTESFTPDQSAYEALLPKAPAAAVPQGLHLENPNLICGSTTASPTIRAAWTPSANAVSYEYRVTTPQRTTPWTTTVTLPYYDGAFNEGEGTYTFTVRAQNADGDYSAESASCSTTYDQAPTVKFVNTKNFYNPATGKFQLEATDAFGVTNWGMQFHTKEGRDLRIDQVPCSPQTGGKNATATCYARNQFDKFVDGETYIAHGIAKDASGNEGTADHRFVADMSGPTITYTDAQSVYNPDTATFTASASDAAGVGEMHLAFYTSDGATDLRVNEVPCSYAGGYQETKNVSCSIRSGADKLKEGETYIARMFATDGAGNVNSTDMTFTVKRPVLSSSAAFTRCNAFGVTIDNAKGKKLRIDWSGNYTIVDVNSDNYYWWSGDQKPVATMSYKVLDGTTVLASGSADNFGDCVDQGYWNADGTAFGIRKMQHYPADYIVTINWTQNGTAQSTTKKMSEIAQNGWWSGMGRSSVSSFAYVITTTDGKVVYQSNSYANPVVPTPPVTDPTPVDPTPTNPVDNGDTSGNGSTDTTTQPGTDTATNGSTIVTTGQGNVLSDASSSTTQATRQRIARSTAPTRATNILLPTAFGTATPATGSVPSDTDGEVLGANRSNAKGEVLGLSDDKAASQSHAWYLWIILALAAIGALWWMIAAARRRRQEGY